MVSKMMAKQPENRFQTPAEVARPCTLLQGRENDSRCDDHEAGYQSRPSRRRQLLIRPLAMPPASLQHHRHFQVPADSLVVAGPRQPAVEQESTDRPGRPPTWMWPAVAAGVLLLAGLSTWASGIFRQKAPEAMTKQQGQAALSQVAAGQEQPRSEAPVRPSPAELTFPAVEQKTESRTAAPRPAAELASVGTGTKDTTELDGRPGPLTPPEGSPNISGNRPEMPPPRKVEEVASTALRGPSAAPALFRATSPSLRPGSWRMTVPVELRLAAEGNERAPDRSGPSSAQATRRPGWSAIQPRSS